MKYQFENKDITQIRKTFEKIRQEFKNKNNIKFAVYVLECKPLYDDIDEMKKFIRNIKYDFISEEQLEQKAKRMAEREDEDIEIVRRSLKESEYTYPDYYDLALHAETNLYVGQTNDIITRLQQHLGGNGANFTSMFVPTGLTRIEWFEDRITAEERESNLADELSTYSEEDYTIVTRRTDNKNTENISKYTFAYSR
jgi:predicted GIY-YIG superfamily endonuclease